MGVISRGSNPKLLWPGLNKVYGLAYKEYPEEWRPCYELANSDKAYEEEVAMTGMGLTPVKPEGAAITYDTMKQSYITRYTNVSYGLGYIITREEFADNLYAQVGVQRTKNLAFSMRQTKENVGANIFNRAFSSSYKGGDGVSMLNLLHPTEGGTFANKLAVDADLSETSLEQAIIDISKFVDNRGNTISVQAQKLIVPAELAFEAKRILGNPLRPATADRDINAMYQMGEIPQGYMVNHYLSDADAWFLITNCPNGLKHFEREAPRFEDDNDFDTKNGKFSGYYRDAFGWTDPRGVFGSAGA